MASPPMAKIVLKNTTKMSLNERFTGYRQQAQSAANTFRQKMQMQRQASVENRRLAQQMANRPTVIAALRLKKRSLQQRLGQKRNPLAAAGAKSNVKARLTFNTRSNASPIQGRLGGMRSYRGRNLSARRGVNRGGFIRPGTSPMIKARLGSVTGFNYGTSFRQNQRGGFRGRRNFNRGGQQFRNNPRNQIGRGANRMRGQGDGRRQGPRGRGGWNKGIKPIPTKQELDNQLDEYMAETKSTLDAQLTQYMSQGY